MHVPMIQPKSILLMIITVSAVLDSLIACMHCIL